MLPCSSACRGRSTVKGAFLLKGERFWHEVSLAGQRLHNWQEKTWYILSVEVSLWCRYIRVEEGITGKLLFMFYRKLILPLFSGKTATQLWRQRNWQGAASLLFHAVYGLVATNAGVFIFKYMTVCPVGLLEIYICRVGISTTFLNNNILLFSAWGKN